MLQCVEFGCVNKLFLDHLMCCSILQCVAACCSVLQCVAVCCVWLPYRIVLGSFSVLQCVAVCCSVLQYVAVCYSVCCSGKGSRNIAINLAVLRLCCSVLDVL